VDRDHLVDVLAYQTERFAADLLDRDPIGEQPDVSELDTASRRYRARHRIRILGLDADYLDLRTNPLHVGGDSRNDAAAADGHIDRGQRPRMLTQDFHSDRTLAGDDVGIVVRVDDGQTSIDGERECV